MKSKRIILRENIKKIFDFVKENSAKDNYSDRRRYKSIIFSYDTEECSIVERAIGKSLNIPNISILWNYPNEWDFEQTNHKKKEEFFKERDFIRVRGMYSIICHLGENLMLLELKEKGCIHRIILKIEEKFICNSCGERLVFHRQVIDNSSINLDTDLLTEYEVPNEYLHMIKTVKELRKK